LQDVVEGEGGHERNYTFAGLSAMSYL
jgi:hypothetical protein